MDAKEFRGESSKSWNNCNTTSSGARNAAPRRCGVARGASNGFEEVDQLDKKIYHAEAQRFYDAKSGAEVVYTPAKAQSLTHLTRGNALDLWDSGQENLDKF